ncbi:MULTISPECIES: formyltetrahydrofolate deformylase [Oligella]|uniref:Formyltetrahydrofolate deformylase n=2 Tax=Oligella urethralis TaxID=90245 RepID=A0A096AJX1_9BURK|nr:MULTISPECIES: formyltetrahydrofolate deformylase [Oligella]KGF30967.1 formyltetrahydrofolate deformylase [Oligella urethralis DNF00040]OFS83866.1 formyltetrahydrofolate deformylase [Oligella sp. HMSC05A10]OFV50005.1 formyltetrahydrofolate deformylase [Oligella sp. HMSC09E12]WOS37090.1 Formyltetrahydrofolate deformylase [Oligella urethralis]SPY07909.1 Formyltetrahydrofolate deformylase [Oligella urethralis]
MSNHHEFILTISCPDQVGIVYNISGTLLELEGNILTSQQYGDEDTKQFFLRIRFSVPASITQEQIEAALAPAKARFNMDLNLYATTKKSRVLILVSKQGHCLNDLLFRTHSGLLNMEIVGIVSNHRDYEKLAESYDIPYHYLPVSNDNRAEQEAEIFRLVTELEVDLVVLARYMQILSEELSNKLEAKAINIHHSFLPSFKGAKPYHQAHQRGVKIIGATAHYVTSDLDEGPIIEQDVQRVDHRLSAESLAQVGSDIESLVLSRAVKSFIEHRILLNGHRTVVFK